MFDIEGSLDAQILQVPRARPTVVFIEPLDPRVLEAACHLTRFVRPVFLAPEGVVREVVAGALEAIDPDRVEYTLSESAFVDLERQPEMVETFAAAHVAACEEAGRKVTIAEARRLMAEPAQFGINAVRLGHADLVVGGAAHEARDFFRPMIKALTKSYLPCEAGVFVLPDDHPEGIFPRNIVVFGDVGVNGTMGPEVLANVAVGTCAVARDVIPEDVLPEIHGAIVSYSYRGSDEGPSPELVRRAAELVPGILADRIRHGTRYASIRIQAEVKLNVAVSARSALYYGGAGEQSRAGWPNVIICPNLDMGNLLYHLYATRYPAAKKFTVMFGVQFRGVDLAMDCTPEDVRLSVKAAVVRLHRDGQWRRTPKDTFFRSYRVLAVNPLAASTKIAVYEGEQEVYATELQHAPADLEGRGVAAQAAVRGDLIVKDLGRRGFDLDRFDAVSARGGLLRPVRHGTYRVNEAMLECLRQGSLGHHPSNLGALVADELVRNNGKPAFIVDPVVVDEVPERAKITGLKSVRRRIVSHALVQIAAARRYAEERETFYDKVNVIVAHMGSAISVGAHRKGRYIDVNNALDGEGPFGPRSAGSLPAGQLIELCLSGTWERNDLRALNAGRGGLVDLLGTAELAEVERRVESGDGEARRILEAMAYQVAKAIAALVPAFDGEPVDRILLTGGMARSRLLVDSVTKLLGSIGCGIVVYPGEDELYALAKGALRALAGKEKALAYEAPA